MKTVWKMLAVQFAAIGLVTWYLSGHPQPLSHSDSIFLLASTPISVWVSFLVWKIDCLREEIEELKAKTA